MFTEQDVRSIAKVAVIGKTVADQLYPGQDPVGQTIRIRNLPFKVIGVLESKGFNLFGQDQDDTVIVPYSSHMKRITTRTFVNSILVESASAEVIDKVQNDITDLLKTRHRSIEQDFTVRNQVELAQAATATSKIMSVLLTIVASVSLFIGGIGIMNIMLVSVTERTREIGIRMAVGARARDILIQFLVEAVTLSAFGGLVGIAFGIVSSQVVAHATGWPTLTPFAWIGIACLSSAVIASSPVFIPRGKLPGSTRSMLCVTNSA